VLFLNTSKVPVDSLKGITKQNEFQVGFGLIEIE
jgi:hypothetical protein